MKILKELIEDNIPFKWLNLEYFPKSECFRKEIYIKDNLNKIEGLKSLFFLVFGKFEEDIIISNGQWGSFTLDTWDIKSNENNYEINKKSKEAKDYLRLLKDSNINFEYAGLCACSEWNTFLDIILRCIINHKAPKSPLFFNLKNEFLFYFHHSGSIGLLYRHNNDAINSILEILDKDFIVLKN